MDNAITDKQIEHILRLHNDNIRTVAISRRLKIPYSIILEILLNNNLAPTRPAPTTTLCWKCGNAYSHLCRRFRVPFSKLPLPEWKEYELEYIIAGSGNARKKTESYLVIQCDNYVPDKKSQKNNRRI